MMRKLVVTMMAIFFSLSVSGVSFAQEKPAAKPAPSQPCVGAEKHQDVPGGEKRYTPQGAPVKKKAKTAQALADKKAACLEKATTDEAKAECEKKSAEKTKKAKRAARRAAKKEEAQTMAPEKPAAPAEKK